MTVIYKVNSLFFLLIIYLSVALAQNPTEFHSYCFNGNVNLKSVHQSLTILLLPKDSVEFRNEDNCLDIELSATRGKFVEQYLDQKFHLKKEVSASDDTLNKQDCRIDLKTTTKAILETINLKIGERNTLNKTEGSSNSTSTMELFLGTGKSGEIGVGDENLKVSCRLIRSDSASINFSYVEKSKASVSTELLLKKNEWVNIASVLKDLEDKTKTLGMPQMEISKTKGKIETIYEMQFK